MIKGNKSVRRIVTVDYVDKNTAIDIGFAGPGRPYIAFATNKKLEFKGFAFDNLKVAKWVAKQLTLFVESQKE